MGYGQVPQAKVVIPGTCGRESVPDFADETAKTEWSALMGPIPDSAALSIVW